MRKKQKNRTDLKYLQLRGWSVRERPDWLPVKLLSVPIVAEASDVSKLESDVSLREFCKAACK